MAYSGGQSGSLRHALAAVSGGGAGAAKAAPGIHPFVFLFFSTRQKLVLKGSCLLSRSSVMMQIQTTKHRNNDKTVVVRNDKNQFCRNLFCRGQKIPTKPSMYSKYAGS